MAVKHVLPSLSLLYAFDIMYRCTGMYNAYCMVSQVYSFPVIFQVDDKTDFVPSTELSIEDLMKQMQSL